MVKKEFVAEEVERIMHDTERVRNVAIIAHVHHGKTTLTDSLLARAGIISKTVAGEALYTNYEAIEKERRNICKMPQGTGLQAAPWRMPCSLGQSCSSDMMSWICPP